MPYIVTTLERRVDYDVERADTVVRSRLAVATLEEAQAYVSGLASAILDWPANVEASRRAANQLWHLPESGGSIGPLPDGTVIQVEFMRWVDMAAEFAPEEKRHMDGWGAGHLAWHRRTVLDAYNAREAQRA